MKIIGWFMFYFIKKYTFLLSIFLISGCCLASQKIENGKEALSFQNNDKCEAYKEKFMQHMSDGWLVVNQLDRLQHADLLYELKSVGSLMFTIYGEDIDTDNKFDTLFVESVTNPYHVATNIYFLQHVDKKQFISIADNRHKSPYYEDFKQKIFTEYKWDNRIPEVGMTFIAPSENLKKHKIKDDPWQITLTKIQGDVILVIRGVESKMLYVAKFKKGDMFEQEMICYFPNLLTY